jgi:hypothetical protein
MSCLKLSATSKQDSSALAAAAAAVSAAGAFDLAGPVSSPGQAAESATGSSSSSSSRVSSDVARMGMVLRARGLRHAGQAILGSLAAPTATSSGAGGHAGVAEAAATGGAAAADAPNTTPAAQVMEISRVHLPTWLEAAHGLSLALPAVALPGGPGSEQACAAARQQLLQLQGHLQQSLQDALSSSSSNGSSSGGSKSARRHLTAKRQYRRHAVDSGDCSSSSTDVAAAGSTPDQLQQSSTNGAALPVIAQRMVSLGEALCAHLPLAYCCNDTGCVELRGASELQLVGGKRCVCGCCRCVA